MEYFNFFFFKTRLIILRHDSIWFLVRNAVESAIIHDLLVLDGVIVPSVLFWLGVRYMHGKKLVNFLLDILKKNKLMHYDENNYQIRVVKTSTYV